MEIITPVIKAIIIGVLVFLSVLSVTIFIAYQQYKFQENKNHEELLRELHHIKDRFRNILYADITTANSMAILFKEYGTPKNFDHIAAQLLQNNKYAEAIQLTVDGVITNVYPRKGFEKTIGINTERDTLRKHEASRAKEKNEIYFAGPRPLRMGGIGILGKVPIILNHDLKAICVVLTKLETIKAGLHLNSGTKNKFAFGLLKKTPEGDTVRYF